MYKHILRHNNMLYVHSITMIYHYLIILLFWVRVNPGPDTVAEPTLTHRGGADPDTPSRCYPQKYWAVTIPVVTWRCQQRETGKP